MPKAGVEYSRPGASMIILSPRLSQADNSAGLRAPAAAALAKNLLFHKNSGLSSGLRGNSVSARQLPEQNPISVFKSPEPFIFP